MALLALPFPVIDPVLIEIGPIAIRWYALAYIGGFLFGWWLAKRLVATDRLWPGGKAPFAPAVIDDAIVWAALCGILGGRLAFVFVYNLDYYLAHPAAVLAVWEGGMAFHGGIVGAVVGLLIFARRNSLPLLPLIDLAAVVAPIGIALGRLANFIKPELWGRVADVPWAIIFPGAGPEPRHPSQIYQALTEGLLLFIVLLLIARSGGLKRPGLVAGCFGIGYGLARSFGELFRQPDPQLGFLFAGATMGQLLSVPLVAVGLWLVLRARRLPA
ncbi:prolipoprotein diacylglyceryl transferase [Phreatobacter cathodiphilus]|uniref:Phosphatidylglycerol--prolipoprotein diacylglyceryl transferase n=1 Tax=Phreatobacter cathodiphilus TaxID=1868589 RepID=A0A2S0NI10_9HYPH|nr:prolipoprotein diacylglyceryl transferase [Phreatobacter cathodiphilus]AVO47561.1 prolipoprotein diacylglyceryl transferase [Phreatobacter cathodiphilus]